MSGMPPALQVAVLIGGVLVMLIAVLIPVRLALLFRRESREGDAAQEGDGLAPERRPET